MSTSPYRVAIRSEGPDLNFYWARTDTMVGAELIGHLQVSVVRDSPHIWEAVQVLMQMVSVQKLQAMFPDAKITEISVTEAPEHERAGSA
jgi:hypothetical protein